MDLIRQFQTVPLLNDVSQIQAAILTLKHMQMSMAITLFSIQMMVGQDHHAVCQDPPESST